MTAGPSMSEPIAEDGAGRRLSGETNATENGPGMSLRRAREQADIHIAALASALKVPVARLEALEAERFDLLPDPPFVRALAASVCRVLKLDPTAILAQLPQPARPSLAQHTSTAGPSFRIDARGSGRSGGSLSRPLIGAVVLLVIAAGALLVLPRTRLSQWTGESSATGAVVASSGADASGVEASAADRGAEGAAVPAVAGSGAATVPGTGSARASLDAASSSDPSSGAKSASANPGGVGGSARPTEASPATAAGTADGVAGSGATPPGAAKPAAAVQSDAGKAAASTARAPTGLAATAGTDSASGATAAAPGQGLLTLQATQQSWVKVTDAKGAVVLQKNLEPGASESVGGELPLSVIVGRADATAVTVRGKSFALGPVTRNNVARFEVK